MQSWRESLYKLHVRIQMTQMIKTSQYNTGHVLIFNFSPLISAYQGHEDKYGNLTDWITSWGLGLIVDTQKSQCSYMLCDQLSWFLQGQGVSWDSPKQIRIVGHPTLLFKSGGFRARPSRLKSFFCNCHMNNLDQVTQCSVPQFLYL